MLAPEPAPEIEIDPAVAAADRDRIAALVRRTLRAEGRSRSRVSVSFVDTPTMERLNREHRGQPRPTDVLSWPFDETFPQGPGGEVIVCREQADPGQPDAVDRLIVHGVLHLLGYEDTTAAGLAEMERRTDRIMQEADAPAA